MFLLIALSLSVTDPQPPVPCEVVREKIAEHGKAAALAWALKNLSLRQIYQIRRTCKV